MVLFILAIGKMMQMMQISWRICYCCAGWVELVETQRWTTIAMNSFDVPKIKPLAPWFRSINLNNSLSCVLEVLEMLG